MDGKFYNSRTKLELIIDDQIEEAKKYQKIAEDKLELSDRVVNGDLLRFYTPEEFIPVDPSQFNYNEFQNDESK